ncbi:MAG TPA: ATP synthase F0 subunit C, partial [bacterium]|nr:ATP synthase F0 subunit C [bacterium]
EAIGRNPEANGKIAPLMFVAMAITESTGIYSLVIALIILFA